MGMFAKQMNVDVRELPVTGDAVIDNQDLPIELRQLRKRVYDKGRQTGGIIKGKSAQKKLEKEYRRDFWNTPEGARLEKEFPNLPGHVRIMIPEIRAIASSQREALLLLELAKSAKSRNLIGSLLRKGLDNESVLRAYQKKSADPSLQKKINQSFDRLEKALRKIQKS
jgi:hypothetical protein